MRGGVQLIIALCYCVCIVCTMRCVRAPDGVIASKSPGDGRFNLMISGNPDKYVPGTAYTVSIQGPRNVHVPPKFIGFSLIVESTNPFRVSERPEAEIPPVGSLHLFADALVKHSEKCPNMVTHTSSIAKTEIQVRWIAPPAGSGCVVFKATVVEHRDVWYQDDGPLTKTLCEDIQENHDKQPDVLEECCACNEAKYEVAFEGMWSRHTHPKDFPSNSWLTRFSDVIGASHTTHYRFWDYGAQATEGLRLVAERGSTRRLESELKNNSQDIRTIIKARGISYPNVTGKTFAVFRVDRKNHLMSLVSMIDPSPDWIVGVSGLELCLKNCSWIESKVLNLYPWDAGTDSGVTYISPDMPTEPRDVIRRITSSFPNDIRSPFFDPSGEEMKPLARLHLTRQRIYPQKCEDPITNGSACNVGEWGEWSECSVTCGHGNRKKQRFYLQPDVADQFGCRKRLTHRATCYGVHPCGPSEPVEPTEDPICTFREWSDWSRCSVSCGQGTRKRYRTLKSRSAWKYCGSKGLAQTQQTDECYTYSGLCQNGKLPTEEPKEKHGPCEMTEWSDWSPCNATCELRTGIQVRTRQLLRYKGILEMTTSSDENEGEDDNETEGEKKEEGEDVQEENENGENKEELCPEISRIEEVPCEISVKCTFTSSEIKEICQMPKDEGKCNLELKRYYFDAAAQECREFAWFGCRGNKNNFETLEHCETRCASYRETTEEENTTPVTIPDPKPESLVTEVTERTTDVFLVQPAVDCKVTKWTKWSPCSATCGKAYKYKSRSILVSSRNGGRACPKKIIKKRKCKALPRCPDSERSGKDKESGCTYTEWTDWTQCTATCGSNAIQQRTRSIDYKKTEQGAICNERIMTRACPVPPCKGVFTREQNAPK